ncbi:MAG: 30S ribosomal protein S13 [Phycisphaerae bacterium]|nr:30S ribosomal protein S13 [Phycisphaerae bacterium]|tara:strand:+ start:899 stop:1276 length:378 start_codon:yes stop_codon:yes gene_type:complete
MPRIAGVDIPDNKKILYSLQYIYGIGPQTAAVILERTNIDVDRRARELTDEEVASIASEIDDNHIVEGSLRRQLQQDIQRLKDIRCWRGDRHRRGLPVRGQRTRCNARTRKGRKKTVAGKKGVKG